ncbi:uncharacterized protein K460DRAFT_370150 [Cucurbitaria berberidis CBS 394.84]|uniref:Uncharacterized protein n=1 Tax=Cucurbitaria berberidis CBS 394.84 TaxID=1168544 RepID=A0A9P4GAQ9_9PLEO|nr:uncharacterized protein K460DRAFT_370150 [Cucurbitaria berberidis CBS 394.84]KAF1842162.1 hypothetical protein K460DRAFT_370150 [Cucurbitaria berberidis CBS 394.84]
MPPTAGPSKTGRDGTKKGKAKQQQMRDDSESESEADIPDNAIYGPRGETKRQFDARVGAQPVHDASWEAFQRRAKARKGKPIEYEQMAYSDENVLRIDPYLMPDSNVRILRQITFAPSEDVDDSTIVDLVKDSDALFKAGLRVFMAGDVSRTKTIDITDAGVAKVVKACPNLIAVALHGTRNLGSNALPAILKGCQNIESVTISVAKDHVSKKTRLNGFLNWLCDKDFVPKLRFLEFRGVYLRPDHRNFLDFLTKRRPALEIIYEYTGEAELIRDMASVPLSRVPQRPATSGTKEAEPAMTQLGRRCFGNPLKEAGNSSASSGVRLAGAAAANDKDDDDDDEDAWEDEDESDEDESDEGEYDDIDEHLISNDPRANARMLQRLGQQSALREALGRDLEDFEMDSDYDDDGIDSDQEMSPQDTREMLKIMQMMDREMRRGR